MYRKSLTTLAVALAVGLAGTFAAGIAEAAPKFKKRNGGPGIMLSRVHAQGQAFGFMPRFAKIRIAKRNAIQNWRAKVERRMGPAFSSWRIAQGKQVDCFGRLAVVCEVSAYPRPSGFFLGSSGEGENDFGSDHDDTGVGSGIQVTIFQ